MYGLLSGGQQASFGRWAAAHGSRTMRVPGWPTYAHDIGYDAVLPTCTVAQWFDTISGATVMKDGKDALSPPAPYRRHDTGELIPYAMGKYGVDGQHVLAEFRSLQRDWTRSKIGLPDLHDVVSRWAAAALLAGNGVGALDELGSIDHLTLDQRVPYEPYV